MSDRPGTDARPQGVRLLGVGNAQRGDDAVGLVIAQRLGQLLGPDAEVRLHHGEGAGLMDDWAGARTVYLFDAVQAAGRPGTVIRFDAAETRLPTRFFHYSSHAFSVAEAVELARALGTLPPHLIVYGVEGARFDAGAPLSPAVAAAADEVVVRVAAERGRPQAG